jgi:hypothetical protein
LGFLMARLVAQNRTGEARRAPNAEAGSFEAGRLKQRSQTSER